MYIHSHYLSSGDYKNIDIYHVANCNWANSLKFSVFQSFFIPRENNLYVIGDFICWQIIPKMISLNFADLLQYSIWFLMMPPTRHATFNTMAGGRHIVNFERCFWLKNWPFYGQFGSKYDRECILDGIIYHFINFRKCLNAGIRQF